MTKRANTQCLLVGPQSWQKIIETSINAARQGGLFRKA